MLLRTLAYFALTCLKISSIRLGERGFGVGFSGLVILAVMDVLVDGLLPEAFWDNAHGPDVFAVLSCSSSNRQRVFLNGCAPVRFYSSPLVSLLFVSEENS